MLADPDLEDLVGHLGEFGRYQLIQHLLHVLGGFTAGLHMLTLVTIAPTPPHRCFVPGVDLDNSTASWDEVSSSIPFKTDGSPESCQIWDAANNSAQCDRWVYNTSIFTSSRVMEWDMVCDRRWMRALSQSLYMFGVLAGAVVLGTLADKVGRKKIFCISGLLQVIFGLLAAFCPEYISFIVVCFIYGFFGSAGAYVTGFVLSMEMVGPTKRTICGTMFQAAFAVGVMLVAGWGAIIPDWFTLQIIYGLHGIVLLPHWWLVDESVRWLWSQGRIKEAVAIVQKGLKVNGQDTVLDAVEYENKASAHDARRRKEAEERGDDNEDRSYGLADLFRTRNLRMKTLNVCLNWMANSLAYYGLSLNTDKLQGNPFLLLFLVGLAEWPAYAMVVLLLDRLGRRPMICGCMLIGGMALLIAAFIPITSDLITNIVIALTLTGKFMIAGSFAIIYNYTAELFPTVVRNSAIGLGSMCARFAGALTPFISLLDSVEKTLPSIIFGTLALLSGTMSLLLPETLNAALPQTIEDGEKFGEGDTCCTAFRKGRVSRRKEIASHAEVANGTNVVLLDHRPT